MWMAGLNTVASSSSRLLLLPASVMHCCPTTHGAMCRFYCDQGQVGNRDLHYIRWQAKCKTTAHVSPISHYILALSAALRSVSREV